MSQPNDEHTPLVDAPPPRHSAATRWLSTIPFIVWILLVVIPLYVLVLLLMLGDAIQTKITGVSCKPLLRCKWLALPSLSVLVYLHCRNGSGSDMFKRKKLDRSQLMMAEMLLWEILHSCGIHAQTVDITAKPTGPATCDLVLPADSTTLPIVGLYSALKAALKAQIAQSPLADAFAADPLKPRHVVHGMHTPLDLTTPDLQLFTSLPSLVGFWAARYCFTSRASSGDGLVHLVPTDGEDPAAWADVPTRATVGYVYLLKLTKPTEFYDFTPSQKELNLPTPTDEQRPQVARRNGYFNAEAYLGHPTDVPDAFIFTTEAAAKCGLEVAFTWRIVNPRTHHNKAVEHLLERRS